VLAEHSTQNIYHQARSGRLVLQPGQQVTVLELPVLHMLPLFMLQLPDGNEIQVGVDRFKVPELLFQPVSMFKSC
jgi:hypothetical protein